MDNEGRKRLPLQRRDAEEPEGRRRPPNRTSLLQSNASLVEVVRNTSTCNRSCESWLKIAGTR